MIPVQQRELIELIDTSINDFMSDIPDTQKKSFNKLLELIKELDTENGSILNNLKNIKILGNIRSEMDTILLNKTYIKKVANFTRAYDKVAQLNNEYYSALNDKFSPMSVLKAIKKLNIDSTIEQLTENGIAAKYTDAIKEILKTNITSGASYSDMVDQLQNAMLGKEDQPGLLEMYASQIVTDSIHQYNRQYNKAITDDLEFEWFGYSGTIVKKSRPFCVHLHDRKFFHKSEVPDLLNGIIGDSVVDVSAWTGLPMGMIEGTNEETFFVNAGGYRCNHVIYGVSSVIVPAALKKEVEAA